MFVAAFISCVAIQSIERKRVLVQACRLAHLSVCLSVRWVNCGNTADWIWMLFGLMMGPVEGWVYEVGGDRRRGRGRSGCKCGAFRCNQ